MSKTFKDKKKKYYTGNKAVKRETKENRGKLNKLTEKVPKGTLKKMSGNIWNFI